MIFKMKQASAMALAFVFVGTMGAGCTKLGQQDPYADKSDAIKNGIPPTNQGPKAPKPVASDALRIQAQDYYSFKEGEEGKFSVTGQVLVPVNGQEAKYGTDFTLEIVNIGDFPGAIWDANSATMKWTPPEGFVDKEYSRNMRLLVRLSTVATPIMVREQEVKIFVIRSERDPEIVSVEDLSKYWTREGERRKFTVVVKDPDSMDADKMRPRLMVIATTQGERNAANLVYEFKPNVWDEKNPTQDPLDPTKWIFTMILDTMDDQGNAREITKGLEKFQFGLVAANRYGGSTAPRIVNAPIASNLREAVTSWLTKEPIEMVAGQENTFSFSVYDPQGEAKVEAYPTRCDLLPGTPSCICIPQDRETAQLCTIRWKPPVNQVGQTLEVKGEAISSSRIQGDTLPPKKTKFSGRVKIIKGPDPVPQPNPNPAPAAPSEGEPSNTPANAAGGRQ